MERLDVDELKEQLAFERIHPFEDGYWQAAQICSTVARAMGAKGKWAQLESYLPHKEEAERKPGIKVSPGVLDRIRRAKAKKGEGK